MCLRFVIPSAELLNLRAIDYIFVNGVRGIVQSCVVFTPCNPTASERVSVSDHSAVLTSIRLP